jgi:hypothetical protein
MPSLINPANPTEIVATTQSIRDNFAAAKAEIEDLQLTKETASNKDVSGGYVGLTLFKINIKNALGTITSFFTNSNTTPRTYTTIDASGTIPLYSSDISGLIGLDGSQIAGFGIPSAFTSRVLLPADNGEMLVCATLQTATVNSGMVSGFGCSFSGDITFVAGAGVVINDSRLAGSPTAFCGLIQVGVDSYKIIGSTV